MDTATRSVAHRPELVTSTATMPAETVTAARTLSVSATYLLSETGRKASLLSGGNGRAVQQIQVNVPVNRLHLVNVSGKGIARLKLRPRFERDGEDGCWMLTRRRRTTPRPQSKTCSEARIASWTLSCRRKTFRSVDAVMRASGARSGGGVSKRSDARALAHASPRRRSSTTERGRRISTLPRIRFGS